MMYDMIFSAYEDFCKCAKKSKWEKLEDGSYLGVFEFTGIKKEDVSVNYTGRYLTIEGKVDEKTDLLKRKQNIIYEYEFEKEIDPDKIEATYNNGLLLLKVIPKIQKGVSIIIKD